MATVARLAVGASTSVLKAAAVLGAIVGLWYVGVLLAGLPDYILPTPLTVFQVMLRDREVFLSNGLTTLTEVVIGLGVATIIGFPVGVLIASSRLMEKTVFPILITVRTIPTVALAPLFVLLFGFGLLPKIIVVFLTAFFPIVVSSALGLKSVPIEMIFLVRSMGADWGRRFSKVMFPYALPYIFSGLKLGASLAVVGAIVGEFIGASSGLGYLIRFSASLLNTSVVYGGIVFTVLMSVALFTVTALLERAVIPWHVSQRSGAGRGR